MNQLIPSRRVIQVKIGVATRGNNQSIQLCSNIRGYQRSIAKTAHWDIGSASAARTSTLEVPTTVNGKVCLVHHGCKFTDVHDGVLDQRCTQSNPGNPVGCSSCSCNLMTLDWIIL